MYWSGAPAADDDEGQAAKASTPGWAPRVAWSSRLRELGGGHGLT
jgi:hypothetical protein